MKKLFLALLIVVFGFGVAPAEAQLGSVPHTFQLGTTILSAEVNTNFSTVYSNALNRTGGTMTGTLTAQVILPDGDNTRNFGSAAASWANAWFDGAVTVGTLVGSTGSGTPISITSDASGVRMPFTASGAGAIQIDFQLVSNGASLFFGMNPPGAEGTAYWDNRLTGGAARKFQFRIDGNQVAAISSTGVLTANGFGVHDFTAAGTGENSIRVRNTTAGTGNFAALYAGTNTAANALAVGAFSSTFTSAGVNFANGAVVNATQSGGLSIAASNASGTIRFYTGVDPSLRFTITADGAFSWSAFSTAHAFNAGGTGAQTFAVVNPTPGTGNFARINIQSQGTSNGWLAMSAFSSTFTSSAPDFANGASVNSVGPGGLSLVAFNASGAIRFYTGGAAERARLHTTGGLRLSSLNPTIDPGPSGLSLGGIIEFDNQVVGLTCDGTDNNNVGAIADRTITRISTAAGTCRITGIANGRNGQMIMLLRVGATGNQIHLQVEDTNSAAANRIAAYTGCTNPCTSGVSSGALLIYDGTDSRWRIVSRL